MKHGEKRAPEVIWEESNLIPRNTAPRIHRPSATWVLLVLNICGGIAMGLTIVWWNQKTKVWPSSSVLQTAIKLWQWSLPSLFVDAMKNVSTNIIFGLWTIASIAFSSTLVGYLMENNEGKPADKLSWIRIVIALCVCILIGATAEELGLVFMPLTVSCEMVLSSLGRNK